MGKYMWLLLYFWAHVTTSRACSSGSSAPRKTLAKPDYVDYDKEDRPVTGPVSVGVKVINGKETTPGDFPHQVSLQATDYGNKHFCGASIIHPKVLITAAHCFGGARDERRDIIAVAGVHDLKATGTTKQTRQVTAIIAHRSYYKKSDRTAFYDIALLELNEPLKFDDKYIRKVQLWDSAWKLPAKANVSGWGLMDALGTHATKLMAAEINIRVHQDCKKNFANIGRVVPEKTICAGGSRDACEGDSGGPLTCLDESWTNGMKRQYLCGIVSWGVTCNDTNNKYFSGVYTAVSEFQEWIEISW